VKFGCVIGNGGFPSPIISYTVSPGADLLKAEISRRLKQTRFVPAVYNHRLTWAGFAGTAVFVVTNGKPHLRIFAHQDIGEIKRGSDLVWPQSVYVENAPPPKDPGEYPAHEAFLEQPANVMLRHSVDASGNTTDVQVVSERPPGKHFGENAVKIIRGLHYLPAYRNGQPTALTRVFQFRFVVPQS
jgi:TonB family protein